MRTRVQRHAGAGNMWRHGWGRAVTGRQARRPSEVGAAKGFRPAGGLEFYLEVLGSP